MHKYIDVTNCSACLNFDITMNNTKSTYYSTGQSYDINAWSAKCWHYANIAGNPFQMILTYLLKTLKVLSCFLNSHCETESNSAGE